MRSTKQENCTVNKMKQHKHHQIICHRITNTNHCNTHHRKHLIFNIKIGNILVTSCDGQGYTAIR